MRKILASAALVAALAGVAACGGDDSSTSGGSAVSALAKLSGEDKAAAEAVGLKFNESGGGGAVGEITEEQEACVGVALVKNLGAKRVLEISKTDTFGLNEAEAGKAADAFLGCVDVKGLFAAGMAEGGEISQKAADCLAGKVSKDGYRSMVVSIFTGNEDDAEAGLMVDVMKNMAGCLTNEEMAKLGG
jgi:hypothetical protein